MQPRNNRPNIRGQQSQQQEVEELQQQQQNQQRNNNKAQGTSRSSPRLVREALRPPRQPPSRSLKPKPSCRRSRTALAEARQHQDLIQENQLASRTVLKNEEIKENNKAKGTSRSSQRVGGEALRPPPLFVLKPSCRRSTTALAAATQHQGLIQENQ